MNLRPSAAICSILTFRSGTHTDIHISEENYSGETALSSQQPENTHPSLPLV